MFNKDPDWEEAYKIMQNKYLEQHKKAVRYKKALKELSMSDDPYTCDIAREALGVEK